MARSHTARLFVSILLFVAAISLAFAHASSPQTSDGGPLTDFAGVYTDDPGTTLTMVASDSLYAVIDDAKYALKRVAPDVFTNIVGTRIEFHRDASRTVTGYTFEGKLHPRVSAEVPPAVEVLFHPRPAGQDSPASYRYHTPADLHDGIDVDEITNSSFTRATAEKIVHGILDGTWKDVHSVLLYQRGSLVFEEYFYGYDVNRTQELRSATKSVVSALAGIAVARGAISGANVPVASLLSYKSYANPDPRKARITLADFLTMQSGLACNDHSSDSPGRETVIDEAPDWVKATMDLPMLNDPGTKGYYCSGGVAVVGRVVENATRQKLPEFAADNLFAPLGIDRANWKWNYTLTNENKEYSQIHMRPRDMLKLGILYANGGKWEGKQLIPTDWAKTSLSALSTVDETEYGYFWWRPWLNVETPEGTRKVYVSAAQGNGGQKIYIVPEYQLVAVFTGGAYNASGTAPNKIMASTILPAAIAAYGFKPAPEK